MLYTEMVSQNYIKKQKPEKKIHKLHFNMTIKDQVYDDKDQAEYKYQQLFSKCALGHDMKVAL